MKLHLNFRKISVITMKNLTLINIFITNDERCFSNKYSPSTTDGSQHPSYLLPNRCYTIHIKPSQNIVQGLRNKNMYPFFMCI